MAHFPRALRSLVIAFDRRARIVGNNARRRKCFRGLFAIDYFAMLRNEDKH
jgi:hypothetical protein